MSKMSHKTNMEYDVYIDESGDLGWKLENEYRKDGSSNFFTIAYIILPTEKEKHIGRVIKKFHEDRGGSDKEIKATQIRKGRAKSLSKRIAAFLDRHNDIVIGSVTINKRKVPPKLANTDHQNILYNYMLQRGICSHIAHLAKVNVVPDKRSVPNGSQNSCAELLRSRLWIDLQSDIDINYTPKESHTTKGLMFIDWIANFVWRNYENQFEDAYKILSRHLQEDNLFF